MTQKEVALQIMKKLIKYKPIINAFEKRDEVWFSEGQFGASYTSKDEPVLLAAIEKVEKEHGCKVFHATHNFFEFGECWTLLVVSNYEEYWQDQIDEADDGYVFCWVENVSDPACSEFGTCAFKPSLAGDIQRYS